MIWSHSRSDTAFHLLRIATGLVLALAGINKLINSNPEKIAGMIPGWLSSAQSVIGMGLPYVELILGVLLIVGLWTRVVAALSTLLFVGITITMGYGMGYMPSYHLYLVFTSLALAINGTQGCCTVDGMIIQKKKASVQKIKV